MPQAIGAVSAEEALRRCPGLVVRPMRPDRYREVAGQVHELLRRWVQGGPLLPLLLLPPPPHLHVTMPHQAIVHVPMQHAAGGIRYLVTLHRYLCIGCGGDGR